MLSPLIMTKIRVLLIEDHPEVLKRIANRLAQETDIEVAGKASTGVEAVKLAKKINPDLILIDPITDDGSGMATLDKLRDAFPSIAVVVLTAVVDTALQIKLQKLGIRSILEKGLNSKRLIRELRTTNINE